MPWFREKWWQYACHRVHMSEETNTHTLARNKFIPRRFQCWLGTNSDNGMSRHGLGRRNYIQKVLSILHAISFRSSSCSALGNGDDDEDMFAYVFRLNEFRNGHAASLQNTRSLVTRATRAFNCTQIWLVHRICSWKMHTPSHYDATHANPHALHEFSFSMRNTINMLLKAKYTHYLDISWISSPDRFLNAHVTKILRYACQPHMHRTCLTSVCGTRSICPGSTQIFIAIPSLE